LSRYSSKTADWKLLVGSWFAERLVGSESLAMARVPREEAEA